MANLRQYEKDERPALRALIQRMNEVHSKMGGRDTRPERVALLKAMRTLQKVVDTV